ncbi:MAG: hypothetical protein ACXWUC_03105 [Methylosarcina sp.]
MKFQSIAVMLASILVLISTSLLGVFEGRACTALANSGFGGFYDDVGTHVVFMRLDPGQCNARSP